MAGLTDDGRVMRFQCMKDLARSLPDWVLIRDRLHLRISVRVWPNQYNVTFHKTTLAAFRGLFTSEDSSPGLKKCSNIVSHLQSRVS